MTPDPYDEGIKCETALQYRAKNRSMSFLPSEIVLRYHRAHIICTLQSSLYIADKYRVLLKRGNSDYINASFVNV